MAKLRRKYCVKIGIEVTKGTAVTPTLSLLCYNADIKPTAEFEQRRGSGKYTGNNTPGTLNSKTGTFTAKAELTGNGSGALDPTIAALLQGCGMKDNSGYKPISSTADQKTLTIVVWRDGKKKSIIGAMGNIKFESESGKIVYLTVEFTGKWVAPVDEALPATWSPTTQAPMKMASGTFTVGGGAKSISKFSLDMGCNVVMHPDPSATEGFDSYIITDHDEVIGFDPESEAVATYDLDGIWAAETEFAVVLTVTNGTDDVTITCAKAQYKEIPEEEREGIDIYDVTCQCNNDSGDDAVSITAAAA